MSLQELLVCQNIRNIKLHFKSWSMWWRKKKSTLICLWKVYGVGVFFFVLQTQHNTVNRHEANKNKWNCFNFKHIHKMAHKNEFTLFILHRWLSEMAGDSRTFGSSTNRLVVSWIFICLLLYLRLCFYWIATTEQVQ